MRLFFVVLSSTLFLSACVSSETTVTTKNTGAAVKTTFDPKSAAETRVKLALVYLRKDDMQQAKENLDKALEYQPNNANIYRVYAYYSQRVNEDEDAEKYYKKSLSLDSKHPDTYNNFGTFLCRKERYEEAEKAFKILSTPLCLFKAPTKQKSIFSVNSFVFRLLFPDSLSL